MFKTGMHVIHVAAALSAAALCAAPAAAADDALIAAAKREGEVMWYTTLIADQMARPAAAAFEKKYGIKVNYIRANSSDIILRVNTEAKAGKVQADVFDGTSGALALKQAGLLQKWLPDSAKRIPAKYVDPEGYWIATSLYVETFGFNTDLVPKGTEPRTFQALLDPKWKGKLAISASPSAPGVGGFIGLVTTSMGKDKGIAYLKQLAQQKVSVINVSARQVLDQVIAGEYPVGLQMLNHHAAYSAARGAPVDWAPPNPAMAAMLVLGVFKGPHPNAGKLLVDFMMSEEGQNLFRKADYIPVLPSVKAQTPSLRPDDGHFPVIYFAPEELDRNTPAWMKIYQDTLR
jgi:iron(III) transport system substrate-binding protein